MSRPTNKQVSPEMQAASARSERFPPEGGEGKREGREVLKAFKRRKTAELKRQYLGETIAEIRWFQSWKQRRNIDGKTTPENSARAGREAAVANGAVKDNARGWAFVKRHTYTGPPDHIVHGWYRVAGFKGGSLQ